MKRVLTVVGTRPEALKMASVIRALKKQDALETILCSTGQHREMLATAFAEMKIAPDVDLDLMTPGHTLAGFLGRALPALDDLMRELKPDHVLVQGDTASVVAGAMAAFYNGARVGHVEAGLRSHDRRSPFPEEVNRRIAGVTADLHFAPTRGAAANLLREGVDESSVFVTGNTIIDTVKWVAARAADIELPVALRPGARLILLTAHRRESFGDGIRQLCEAIVELADQHDDVEIVYPVHLNPNVREPVQQALRGRDRIHLIPPLGYAQFVKLMVMAHVILTDSGGVQEEAPALGKPTLVLRDRTERPEALETGVVRLIGCHRDRIVEETSRLLTDADLYRRMARPSDVFGDGAAGARIADIVANGRATLPPFRPAAPPHTISRPAAAELVEPVLLPGRGTTLSEVR